MKGSTIFRAFLIVFVICLSGLIAYGYFIVHDTATNGTTTVGKYVYHNALGKNETNSFDYFVSGKRHHADGGRIPDDVSPIVGKFYKIKYSDDHPKITIAFYDSEVTDSVQILNAGFDSADLKSR